MDNNTDAGLVQAYLAGDDAAFERLYTKYERPLFSYMLKFTQNRQTAEDVFQQTWFKVIKGLPQYSEKARFSSWLFGIAHNCSIDRIRKASNKYEQGLTEYVEFIKNDQPAPDEEMMISENKARLAEAINQLPDNQRAIVLMRIHGEIPFKEIAKIMVCSLNTVLGRMHYAVKNLKKIMNKEIGKESANVLS